MSTELKLLYYLCFAEHLNSTPEENRLEVMLELNEVIKDNLLSLDLITLHKYSSARSLAYLVNKDVSHLVSYSQEFIRYNGFRDIITDKELSLGMIWTEYLWHLDFKENSHLHYKFLIELQKYLKTT